jgi:hypothetical protein
MKTLTTALLAAALIAGGVASEYAWAHGKFRHHHSRARIGVFIGAPVVFSPWYYHYPRPFYYRPYYYPAPLVVPSAPPVYIERGSAEPAPAPEQAYWYYCPDSKSYYPYVDRCAVPWQRVAPRPPS